MREHTHTLELLPEQQIRDLLDEKIQTQGHSIEKIELTWNKSATNYTLEVVFVEAISGTSEGDLPALKKDSVIKIGTIDDCEYNALNKLILAGRNLYFRLWNDYPMLQRNLKMNRYFRKSAKSSER